MYYAGMPMQQDEQQQAKRTGVWADLVWLFMFLWVVTGLVGFIWSIMCFGKSGTIAQQIFGFLLALFFGPLYWIYFWSVKKYCR